MDWELAQVNVARLTASLDSPEVAGFVAALEPVNALADATDGFVWRLQTEDGDATAVRVFDDDLIIVNMSTWASLDALAGFVYQSGHAETMRKRRRWFTRMAESHLALWWVPAGYRPTPHEAVERLETLRAKGPGRDAFTFRHQFPPPTPDGGSPAEVEAAVEDDRWGCPTA
jgi:hypothetical protein